MAAAKKTSKAARKTAAKATTPAVNAPSVNVPTPEEIRKLIEEAAYYRAQQRGFTPGHELEDWVEAESEVTRRNGPR